MALDGIYLHHIGHELRGKLEGARVDKIHQPNRDELVFAFRTREAAVKVLFSARANNPRVNVLRTAVENPKQPPMFCMLLRKRLSGAKLVDIKQPQLERVLSFVFEAVNELGDRVPLTLHTEIMGKYSNVILCDEREKIVDALKRVDAAMSSKRLVLPGITYHLPPAQDKLSMLQTCAAELKMALQALPKNMELSKALLSVLQGVSPIVCRELQYQTGRGTDLYTKEMTDEQYLRLSFFYQQMKETVEGYKGKPYMVVDKRRKPLDFSFINPAQYGISAIVSEKASFSELLEDFYHERDTMERMRVKEQDILKLLSGASNRLSRKIAAQQAELAECAKRDTLKIFGDLISANLYAIEKGMKSVRLQNFYDDALPVLDIKLDEMLSPSQNAQKYYNEYRKAKTAEKKLTEQISIANHELAYIESVFEALSRAKTEQDLAEIKAELAEEGYIRVIRSKKEKAPSVSAPLRFEGPDDFTVCVGRNNRQNDRLTKTSNNNDIWFHTKNIPGSHTVLITEGREPTERAMEFAAALAAKHSRAKDSAKVPVDYTQIRHVSKPQGAKPGMVIYVNYQTMFVNPADENGQPD